jgi:DNA-directed RNA polymerase sigma subunit (sigma70/sigma32)
MNARKPKVQVLAPRNGSGGMSHAAIGKVLGISRGRVWQIEQSALAKLRRCLMERMSRRAGGDESEVR